MIDITLVGSQKKVMEGAIDIVRMHEGKRGESSQSERQPICTIICYLPEWPLSPDLHLALILPKRI